MSNTQTDWRALCEELLGAWDAQPLPPYQSSWAGVVSRARALLAQPEPAVVGPTRLRTERRTGPFGEWTALIPCNSPAPAPAGEAGELVAWLIEQAVRAADCKQPMAAGMLTWAAQVVGEHTELLGRCHAAPVAVLPDEAQIIEPTERTILVPVPVPVAVSERPWEREGWCNEKGECWGNWLRTWKVCNPRILDPKSSVLLLPFNSLPLPSGEVG